MQRIRFEGPLSQGATAFSRIAQMQLVIKENPNTELEFYIKNKKRLGRTFAFLIACLPLLAESQAKDLKLVVDDKIYSALDDMGVVQFYANKANRIAISSKAGFRRIKKDEDIIKLVTDITKSVPVEFSDKLAGIMVTKFSEMFNNALEHGDPKCVVGGKYSGNSNRFCFCCYDSGEGIPAVVNKYRESKSMNLLEDADAIKWAMAPGHSTGGTSDGVRGLGLDILNQFAKLNDGIIRICSGHTYCRWKNGEMASFGLTEKFQGTLFEMNIIADNNHRYII